MNQTYKTAGGKDLELSCKHKLLVEPPEEVCCHHFLQVRRWPEQSDEL